MNYDRLPVTLNLFFSFAREQTKRRLKKEFLLLSYRVELRSAMTLALGGDLTLRLRLNRACYLRRPNSPLSEQQKVAN